ncbi:MAG: hypothetical protein ABL957_14575, partial [Parvularculaceae bacterium]
MRNRRSATVQLLLLAAGALLVYAAAAVAINRMPASARLESIGPIAAMPTMPSGAIEVMTWNLGYGGLGAESEFFADGGKDYLPPSRAIVDKNIAGIVAELSKRSDRGVATSCGEMHLDEPIDLASHARPAVELAAQEVRLTGHAADAVCRGRPERSSQRSDHL